MPAILSIFMCRSIKRLLKFPNASKQSLAGGFSFKYFINSAGLISALTSFIKFHNPLRFTTKTHSLSASLIRPSFFNFSNRTL